jgi:PHD/YefM family antitoxin component YafN of YafNO toxin-antitoxin module
MVREKTLDITAARRQLNSFDAMLVATPIIHVCRHGKRAFAVVSVELFTAMQESLSIMADPDAIQLLHESLADIRKETNDATAFENMDRTN